MRWALKHGSWVKFHEIIFGHNFWLLNSVEMRRWSFVAKVMMSTLVMSRTKPQKRCFDASQSVEQIYKVFSNKVQSYKCSQNPLLCINGKIWCDEDLEQIPMLMLFWKKILKRKLSCCILQSHVIIVVLVDLSSLNLRTNRQKRQ